ncbi:MAG: hypothetical protein WCI03_13410 [bacterium]
MKACIQIATLLIAILAMSACTRAPPDEAPVENWQKYYSNTRWYFAPYQAVPSEWNAGKVEDNHGYNNYGIQAYLTTTSGTPMSYEEFEPSTGLKSYLGNGTLIGLPGVSRPIFDVNCWYTQNDPRKILLIGFIGGRGFKIEATHSGTNRPVVLQEALNIAQKAYQQLLDKRLKDKGASNQAPEDTARKLADPQH